MRWYFLCPDVFFLQKNVCQYKYHDQPDHAAGNESSVSSGQYIFAFVGVHARLHQGVGPEQGEAFGADENAGDSADQGEEYREGETSDKHRQDELDGDDCEGSQDTA